jgi:predicted ATP-grasp superfamily ATP-dependent carboligase
MQKPKTILVVEYVTGGGLVTEALSPSLLREGSTMLGALLEDFAACEDIELIAFRDTRLSIPASTSVSSWITIGPESSFDNELSRAAQQVDAVWLIAPETGGALERLSMQIEALGVKLLSVPSLAVRIAANKLITHDLLLQHEIPVVPTRTWTPSDPSFDATSNFVVKPNDGVGCEGVYRFDSMPDQWPAALTRDDLIIQPWVDGISRSLSVLFCGGKATLLSCNTQVLHRQDHSIHLSGCIVNSVPDHDARYQQLLDRIAKALPSLWGYAGIDFIEAEDQLWAVEINPRLTSSYAGLRRATGINLAEAVIQLWQNGSLANLRKSCHHSIPLNLIPEPL